MHNWDTNEIEQKHFRLGKHEKDILRTLLLYREVGGAILKWSYPKSIYSLGNYASEDDIEAYEQGRSVPYWMLKRDLDLSSPTLSRSLRTLYSKELVFLYGGDLEMVVDRTNYSISSYVKFVGLTTGGKRIALTLTNAKCES